MSGSTAGRSSSANDISAFIQVVLRIRGLPRVDAVTAAAWLDAVGILKDSPSRPGKPLRDMLRANMIAGQHQEASHRWFVCRL